jgi:hypothetical protein
MGEMMEAMQIDDEQQIRNALVKIRNGRVKDPGRPGSFLRRKPVRYHHPNKKYYDFSRATASVVRDQVPATVLARQFSDVLTRITTLGSAMGSDGLARSVDDLLDDGAIRELILQLPFDRTFEVANLAMQVAQARQLLELDRVRKALVGFGSGHAIRLPEGTATASSDAEPSDEPRPTVSN